MRVRVILAVLLLGCGTIFLARADKKDDELALKDPLRFHAQAGDLDSQLKLAAEFYSGKNRQRNLELAVYWWRRAAAQNSAPAHFNIGMALEHGWGVEKSPHLARKEYEIAAKAGITMAELRLAELLYHGYPEQKLDIETFPPLTADPHTALKQIRSLCDKKFVPAFRVLAQLLDNSDSRMPHAKEIRECYRVAAEDPNSGPTDWILYAENLRSPFGGTPDTQLALKLLRKAADAGNVEGKACLGAVLLQGEGGSKSREEGVRLIQEAAKLKNPRALCELADMHLFSEEFPCDPVKAYQLFLLAAKQGYPRGMCGVGNCFQHGYGVERDHSAAYMWFDRAARKDDSCGEYRLGMCFRDGIGVEADPQAAKFWFGRAANRVYVPAIREFAFCLLKDHNLSRSKSEDILKMLRFAATNGDALAKEFLQRQGLEEEQP